MTSRKDPMLSAKSAVEYGLVAFGKHSRVHTLAAQNMGPNTSLAQDIVATLMTAMARGREIQGILF